MYLKNEFNAILREDLKEDLFLESLWCNIVVGNNKTLIGLCYRAPSNIKTNDEALYSLISKASTENLVLMGDFNFPEINWSVPESLSEEHSFIKCTNNAYLFQNVLDSTRGKNILDLVLSSEEI